MKNYFAYLIVILFLTGNPGFAQVPKENRTMEYQYESVPEDPLGVLMYTLKNGMKLYMSVNKTEPRIATNIVVRAGSKHDPSDATGLAHYLEHMLFKGTDEIGALNWEREKIMLQNIAWMYEEYSRETDQAKRASIYNKIDRLSNEAAKLVAANEYDKLTSAIGAKGTNAYTSVEQTVYTNDIPSNELERWFQLESERFSQLVLRLFHTEIETVYEEFNISQDRDARKVNKTIREILFPTHPYGTQTTIGKGEHLKNPSLLKIREYFDTYYVPNNMAIVVSGDFDPDRVTALAEKYFGEFRKEKLPSFSFQEQLELKKPVRKEILGQESEFVDIAWRLDGAATDDPDLVTVTTGVLYNRIAGLLDINLNQKQELLSANAWKWLYKDYSVLGITGEPKEGQSLKDVEKLLLAEVEKLKNGDFEDWLVRAVVKDLQLSNIRANESNNARVRAMTNAIVKDIPWERHVNRFKEMRKYYKDDVMQFAQERLGENHVVIYKKNGADKNVHKVSKPPISPVSVNRDKTSEYAGRFLKEQSAPLQSVFLDFEKQIRHASINGGITLDYVPNTANKAFSLYYIFDMGKNNDKKLPLAIAYFPYLGTDKFSAAELKQEFFKFGLRFGVSSTNDRIFISISGLNESVEKGIQLFEHILPNLQPDKKAYENLVDNILTERRNAKKDKRIILRNALDNYARYGKTSPFTDVLSEEELKSLVPEELVETLKSLTTFQHTIYFYGNREINEVKTLLEKYHEVPKNLKPVPAKKDYPPSVVDTNKVYFVHFPMVQAEILMVAQGASQFDLDEHLNSQLYNQYFSSIVFQEIRESKALAYSTYCRYGSPFRKDDPHYLRAYVGTQADKMPEAIRAISDVIENMPLQSDRVENAKQALLKKLESGRVPDKNVYWNFLDAGDKGVSHDMRKDVYQHLKKMTAEDLVGFQEKKVKGQPFVFLVLADKSKIDFSFLESLGEMEELTLEEIFGY